MQGKPWGKSRASASYYPGSVFDLEKLFLHKPCYTPKKKMHNPKGGGKKIHVPGIYPNRPLPPAPPLKKVSALNEKPAIALAWKDSAAPFNGRKKQNVVSKCTLINGRPVSRSPQVLFGRPCFVNSRLSKDCCTQ